MKKLLFGFICCMVILACGCNSENPDEPVNAGSPTPTSSQDTPTPISEEGILLPTEIRINESYFDFFGMTYDWLIEKHGYAPGVGLSYHIGPYSFFENEGITYSYDSNRLDTDIYSEEMADEFAGEYMTEYDFENGRYERSDFVAVYAIFFGSAISEFLSLGTEEPVHIDRIYEFLGDGDYELAYSEMDDVYTLYPMYIHGDFCVGFNFILTEEGEYDVDNIDVWENLGLLDMLMNPELDEYKALGSPALELAAHQRNDSIGAIPDIYMLIPTRDGICLKVEAVEYDPVLNWLAPVETLYDFIMEKGEHYALHVLLSEGSPNLRVTVELNGQRAEWLNSDISMGFGESSDKVTLQAYQPYPKSIDEDSNIINLSGAAATSEMILDEEPDYYFWQTISHALTLNMPPELDPYSDKITVSAEILHSYADALFPGYTAYPPLPEYIPIIYDSDSDTYEVTPNSYGDYTGWELSFIEYWRFDENSVSVFISVTCPDIDEFPVMYEVIWTPNDVLDPNLPFEYHIEQINLIEAVG